LEKEREVANRKWGTGATGKTRFKQRAKGGGILKSDGEVFVKNFST